MYNDDPKNSAALIRRRSRQFIMKVKYASTLYYLNPLLLIAVAGIMTAFVTDLYVAAFVGTSVGMSNQNSLLRTRHVCNIKKLDRAKDKMLQFLDEQEKDANEVLSLGENCEGSEGTSLSYVVTLEDNMKRLDAVVTSVVSGASKSSSISRSLCSNLLSDGHVTVNGKIENRKSMKVSTGMRLEIRLDFTSSSVGQDVNDNGRILEQDIPLSILYEDEFMIVLNKAAGMVVHPAVGNRNGTVVNALAYYLTHQSKHGIGEFYQLDASDCSDDSPENGEFMLEGDDEYIDSPTDFDGPEASLVDYEPKKSLVSLRPGIVHRLDKGTTGVLIVAKTRAALTALAAQFGGGSTTSSAGQDIKTRAEKTYLAITVGNPGQRVVIDRPIGRHPIHRQRMRVVPESAQNTQRRTTKNKPSPKGRRALSFVDTIAFDGKLGFVKVRIETGRTHQIRVHLQDRHTPIYGDDIYGVTDWNKKLNKSYGISRPMLHAYRLKINHPITGESMTFRAPLPDDMRKIIKTIYPLGEHENPDIFDVPVQLNNDTT